MSKKSESKTPQYDPHSPPGRPWTRPDEASAFYGSSSWKIFLSLMTGTFPSANYHGQSEGNHTPLQFLRVLDALHVIIGSAAIRNALREGLAAFVDPKWINRSRLHDQDQPTVGFRGMCGQIGAWDDLLFGWLLAKYGELLRAQGKLAFHRSPLVCNHALSLSPYHPEDPPLIQQVPNVVDRSGNGDGNKNATHSSIIELDTFVSAYQYLLAIDTYLFQGEAREAIVAIMRALGQFSNVAGNHARTCFDFSPESLIGRVTKARTAQFDTYGWSESGENAEIARLNANDLLCPEVSPGGGGEWYIAGEIVRSMQAEKHEEYVRLMGLGVHLFDSPQICLSAMVNAALPITATEQATPGPQAQAEPTSGVQ